MKREPDEIDFGPCCCCGRADVRVQDIVMLCRRAPVPGRGWGCFQCHLPFDGAVYVACDRCIQSGAEPVEVCSGDLISKRRVPIGDLSAEVFDHDFSMHPEYSPGGVR